MLGLPLPPPLLATANVVQIFLHSDVVGQVIVVVLLLLSIVAWSVMLGKSAELGKLRELNHAFERRLRDERKLLDLPESFRDMRSIPYADLFADAVESYWRAAAIGREKGEDSLQAGSNTPRTPLRARSPGKSCATRRTWCGWRRRSRWRRSSGCSARSGE